SSSFPKLSWRYDPEKLLARRPSAQRKQAYGPLAGTTETGWTPGLVRANYSPAQPRSPKPDRDSRMKRPPGEVERMLRPEHRPVELRDLPRGALLVPVEEARSALQEWVDESLQELNESLESVVRDVDARERAAVTDPAAIVMDPEKLRRFKQIGS